MMTIFSKHYAYCLATTALLLGATSVSAEEKPVQELMLVTPEEAIQYQGLAGYDAPRALRARAVIPLIEVLKPETGPEVKIKTPFPITVVFRGQPGTPILPKTFKVLYGAFKFDITDRITKFVEVKEDGFSLDAANIPAGKHRLILHVEDESHRVAERELRIDVE